MEIWEIKEYLKMLSDLSKAVLKDQDISDNDNIDPLTFGGILINIENLKNFLKEQKDYKLLTEFVKGWKYE